MAGHACDGHLHRIESFFPRYGNLNIYLTDNGRTASVTNSWGSGYRHLLGNVIYERGEHDIYVIFKELPPRCSGWIGMNNNVKTLFQLTDSGFLTWCLNYKLHINSGTCVEVDLGQPWQSGDKLHLHLDVDLRSLSILHLRTNKRHTVGYISGYQRLYVCVQTEDKAIITLSRN